MNTIVKKYFLILIILFNFTVGCEPALIIGPIVTGVTYWIQGESHRYFSESHEIVFSATKRILEKNRLYIKKEYVKNDINYIDAGSRNGFKIKIEKVDNFTKLSIRINTFGDKDYTELLYDQIQQECNVIHYKDGKPTELIN